MQKSKRTLASRMRRFFEKRLSKFGLVHSSGDENRSRVNGGRAVKFASPTDRHRRAQVLRRAQSAAIFDPAEYQRLHRDVRDSGMDPAWHFARYGLSEGRGLTSPLAVARLLNQFEATRGSDAEAYLRAFEEAQTLSASAINLASTKTVAIAVHSKANYYMHPIAGALVHALRAAGVRCSLVSEVELAQTKFDFPIIVAPHEFFAFDLPESLKSIDFIETAILYNTEQMPSPWFAQELPRLFQCRAVMDVNFQTSLAYGSAFPAIHVLPPFDEAQILSAYEAQEPDHALFRWAGPAAYEMAAQRQLADRRFDLMFAGFKTPERNRVFIRNAAYFSEKECFLAYTALPGKSTPLSEDTRAIFSNNVAVARNCKISLSIHRYNLGYFEWERMVAQGFAVGASVISTNSLRSPFFEPGVHYFETISRNVDKLVRWVLDTDEGATAAQAAVVRARTVMEEQLTAERVGRLMLTFLAQLDKTDERA